MTIDFSEHFWGSKNNGFDVLYHNMKYGLTASKELGEFFRERSAIEEAHSKSLSKLARISANGTPQGTFAPLWQILKNSTERLASIHLQMMQKIQDLVKELAKYADELQKKYKTVKDEEASTLETVQGIQNITATVQKAKDIYFQRAQELEKLQKDNASQKDIEKAEAKAKKALEDYKLWIGKYSICRDDFEKKMTQACIHFQEVEVAQLTQMKEFLDTYAAVLENNHEMIGQVHEEFRRQCTEMTIENLLEQFVKLKSTGVEKPGSLEVEDIGQMDKSSAGSVGSGDASVNGDRTTGEKKREGNIDISVEEIRTSKGSRRTTSLLNLFIPLSQGNKANSSSKGNDSPSLDLSTGLGQTQPNAASKSTLARTANRGSKWFLRSRRDKKKEKKSRGKKKDATSLSSKDDKSDGDEKDESHKSDTPTAEIDEEGYTVRPKTTWENDKSSFYSSSDSDSDDERKRLRIEIKPLNNGTTPLSASVDELRTTMENLTLSPLGMQVLQGRKVLHDTDSQMKRSQSVSQQIGSSSPPSRHPYTPLSPPVPPPNPRSSPKLPLNGSSSRYADLGDIFAEVGEMQPSLPPKASAAQRNTPTPTSGIAIPRPPSRPRHDALLQRNTSSPSPAMSRTESIGSLDTRSVGSHVIGSRGPSPLTIGMADSIPLAVAFHEIVHACFRGNDENRCQVKMTGDMMVSFPAGIIQVFANNPLPAQLAFRVRTSQPLDNLSSNSELVNVQEDGNELTFEFNMSALIVLLKKHAEQNANASYFNVDILKYHIKPKPGASSCPLHLVAFWKCEKSQTDLRIDYKYNSHAMAPVQSEVPTVPTKVSPAAPALFQVCIAAPVDGGVKSMQSKPTGQWYPSTNRACWKMPCLSSTNENAGVGSLRARFEITSGPSSHGTIAAQFSCENSTLSGSEFTLVGTGYRVSLIKKRFVSGKYTCDTDDVSQRYAVPPDTVTEV
ncbi:unnamed protein product [Allacma fusca]|uniref:F-BAR domain only protein 2 n=1 Tax=Allacma fusca TaxID=39272 RepID=A0A8J2JW82_9HEXA|nr:unnamed protein product [Allacma fusca]